MRNSCLTTDQVLDVFTEELTTRGGQITDTFNDGQRLFVRSILPHVKDVRPHDRMQGGIAIKVTEESLCLYPYLFREVCRNGAIHAEALESLSLSGLHDLDPYSILESIRQAIEICSAPQVFSETVERIRQIDESEIDLVLNILPMFSRHPDLLGTDVISHLLERLFKEKDQSQFGLANVITAVARETKDPQTRWDLEELGGAILISTLTPLPTDSARAARALSVA
jgi:hypothetical protein